MPPEAATQPPAAVPFRQALAFWFKLGFISFGGPAGQIALMHHELVEKRRWLSERRFLHALNYCMVLPGPEAQQLATYLGWLMHRTWGGVAAGLLFVLPSLLLLVGLSWAYVTWGHTPAAAGVLWGIKPVVVALVLQAAHRMGTRTLLHPVLVGLAVAAWVALWAGQAPFPAVLLGAALVGAALGRWYPQGLARPHGHPAARAVGQGPALIDDDTPTPEHARFRWPRLARVLACGAALWVLPMGALTAALGWTHTFTQMGWFFTKAALLTFGGAYAVLPYVHQGAVDHHGWLTAPQMMDGLALGETTPGPLIMVVAFVGFLGGHGQALFGPDARLLAGVAAAVLVTGFTFFPSFLFILAGGPWVESSQRQASLQGPLTAVTAAVVGAILSLALDFGHHVLWPQGLGGPLDATAVALTVAAAVALVRGQRSVPEVMAAGAFIGWLVHGA
jgi:chromate transporter